MKKLLTAEMTWKRVLILAVGSAAVTALLNCIPALERTSLTAPAETLELWIVLAVYIIMNCKGYKDAMLKTFVFFLVSQPLIYLIEVPFKTLGWGLFRYYPFWGVMTVLTIPGSALAYRVKKGDVWSAVILSLANLLMFTMGFDRLSTLIAEFPRFLITLLFCLSMPFAMIALLLKEKRSRTVALVLAVIILLVLLCVFVILTGDSTSTVPVEEGDWTGVLISGTGLDATLEDGRLKLSSHRNGAYIVTLISETGDRLCYDVYVSGGNHYIAVTDPYRPE